jgi:dihydrolipoamide dehydrogenase
MVKIKQKYDVVIIGSGLSGSTCAIRCAQLGLKTLCIDNLLTTDSKKLNPGIFTNPGSLSTVALLESAKLYESILNEINFHGIYIDNLMLNLSQMIQRKDSVINSINQNLTKLFYDYKIDFIHAKSKILNSTTIEILAPTSVKYKTINSDNIVLATESIPISISCAPIDNEFILDSIAAFNLTDVPKRLAILGAGVIGLEIAGIWNRMGVETILLDAQESFLGLTDHQISREAYQIFTAQGLELKLGTRVISTKVSNKKVTIEYQDSYGTHAIRVDKLIVASGRKPNSDHIAAPEANLLLDENGFIHINDKYRTNLPNVYAIGDLTLLGPMLAQKGIAEGVFVAEQISGTQSTPIDYGKMPNVIYTEPEIAWIGQTEQTIKAMGAQVNIGVYPINRNPKGIATNKANGIIKIICCAKTESILGIHIISNNASELISEATLAMEFSANSEDIKNTIHPYPSLVDSIREAINSIDAKC